MPRRNHRPRNARRTPPPWLYENTDRRPLSPEQMAQSLVRRGLATPQILDRPKRNHTQEEEVNR